MMSISHTDQESLLSTTEESIHLSPISTTISTTPAKVTDDWCVPVEGREQQILDKKAIFLQHCFQRIDLHRRRVRVTGIISLLCGILFLFIYFLLPNHEASNYVISVILLVSSCILIPLVLLGICVYECVAASNHRILDKCLRSEESIFFVYGSSQWQRYMSYLKSKRESSNSILEQWFQLGHRTYEARYDRLMKQTEGFAFIGSDGLCIDGHDPYMFGPSFALQSLSCYVHSDPSTNSTDRILQMIVRVGTEEYSKILRDLYFFIPTYITDRQIKNIFDSLALQCQQPQQNSFLLSHV